jgi:hypothetical protein
MHKKPVSARFRAAILLPIAFSLPFLALQLPGEAADDSSSWSRPSAMAVQRITPVETAQNSPHYMSNLDCSLLSYRLTTSSTMQTGCFTETAFGLMDSDSDTVIFNGTDEGVPLYGAGNNSALVPWPGALDVVSLASQVTGGSWMGLYRNPLVSIQDTRDYLGRIDHKQLSAGPDFFVNDSDGKRLLVNPQTLAFSPNGSWAIAETLTGSFVRINLASLDVTRFAPSFAATGISGSFYSNDSITRDGRYAAIQNAAADSFKVYDLHGCQSGACANYDFMSFVRQKIPDLKQISHVRFMNDSVISFQAQTTDPATSGVYALSPSGSIPHLTDYIALGDSYTSGEGAYDYLAGTDTDEDVCHLSRNSYPLLLTHDLFSAAGGHSVACSGAVLNDVGSRSQQYRGQVRGGPTLGQLEQEQPGLLSSVKTNYIPGYIAQHLFVADKLPRVVTVSVGGDDIGFGSIVESCVAPHLSRHISDSTCFDTYEDRAEITQSIDRMVPKWTNLYKQLLSESPGVQLYAVGYPQIVDDTGTCALNVHLNKSELEFSMEAIDYLNEQVAKAASAAGATYVDISQALKGHRLCETASYNVAVNGLTAGKDAGMLGIKVFGHESYHPNALGQQLIEEAILNGTKNLTSGQPHIASPTAAVILDAPKSGRTLYSVQRTTFALHQSVSAGQSLGIRVDGPEYGLVENSTFSVRLGGSAGRLIGTLPSGPDGSIDGTITIPPGAASGDQPIDLVGRTSSGDPLDITQPIQIHDGSGDTDGDGVPDDSDNCAFALNSGQDTDRDGTDDACDGMIGMPVPGTPHAGTSSDESGSEIQDDSSAEGAVEGGDALSSDIADILGDSAAQIQGGVTNSRTDETMQNDEATTAYHGLSVKPLPRQTPVVLRIAPPMNGHISGAHTLAEQRPALLPETPPLVTASSSKKLPLYSAQWLLWGVLLIVSPLVLLAGGLVLDLCHAIIRKRKQ